MARHTMPTRRRVDHVPLYICVMLAQVVIAAIILDQRVYTHVYYWMSLLVETIAASALLVGALLCLFAICSGTRWFRPGVDIRDCYIIEAWALVLVVISMGMFWVGVLRSGGHTGDVQMILVLMAFVILGLGLKAFDFHVEVRRLSAALVRQVAEEVHQ